MKSILTLVIMLKFLYILWNVPKNDGMNLADTLASMSGDVLASFQTLIWKFSLIDKLVDLLS